MGPCYVDTLTRRRQAVLAGQWGQDNDGELGGVAGGVPLSWRTEPPATLEAHESQRSMRSSSVLLLALDPVQLNVL